MRYAVAVAASLMLMTAALAQDTKKALTKSNPIGLTLAVEGLT